MDRKWKGLFSLMPGLSLVFLDQSILPVALPAIQRELNTSSVALEWCVNIYLLFLAMFVLGAGKLGDRIGHRKAFLLGISFFVFGSALCGFAPHVSWLLFARALQGLGGALLIPAQGALIAELFPPEQRGRANGLNVSIGSLFLMFGPLVGGFLTQEVSWRWIFWINLPIVAIGILLVLRYLPPSTPAKVTIDLPGFCFFATAAAGLIVFLMEGAVWGWISWMSLLFFSIFSLFTILLLVREKKADHPFLDLTLFHHPTYAAVVLSVFITQFVLMITVFWAIYFQTGLHYTPLQAGLITFSSCVPVLFLSYLGGFLSDKVGPRVPVGIGFFFLIASFLALGVIEGPSYPTLVTLVVLFGIGVPLIYTPSFSVAMGAVPPIKRGLAFGMISTARNLSATLGLAVIGLLMNVFQLASLKKAPELAGFSKEELVDFLEGVTPQSTPALQAAFSKSQQVSFSMTHLVLAGILIIVCTVIFFLYRRKSSHHLPDSFSEGWD